MTLPNDLPLQRLQFYVTAPYDCGYLPDRRASSLIAAPQGLVDHQIYDELIRHGFRRSGRYTYRPHCAGCHACVPVRLLIEDFTPSRSQRRSWRNHRALEAHIVELQDSPEHFALYQAYQRTRHAGGGMDRDDIEQYRGFLAQSNVETVMVEFREAGVLRMVSVVDCLEEGLSAVYTFYDCTDTAASYGTYSVLWLAEWCRRRGNPHLYLGYWIADSRKMAYKKNFRPLQGLVGGDWVSLDDAG